MLLYRRREEQVEPASGTQGISVKINYRISTHLCRRTKGSLHTRCEVLDSLELLSWSSSSHALGGRRYLRLGMAVTNVSDNTPVCQCRLCVYVGSTCRPVTLCSVLHSIQSKQFKQRNVILIALRHWLVCSQRL